MQESANNANGLKCIISIFNGLIKAVSNEILKYMMICPCCKSESCPIQCRNCWEGFGFTVSCVWTFCVFSSLFIMIALSVARKVTGWFILSFFISSISGWLFSLMFLSCCFRVKWKMEKRNHRNVLNDHNVTYL